MAITMTDASPRTLLEVYLGDHLAAGSAGVDLARRCLSSNPDGELGAFLRRLVSELDEDRVLLSQAIEGLGMTQNQVKVLAARAAERVGRLKLNGQLRGYSPLSRLVELEGLAVGIDARGSMLRVVASLARSEPALRDIPWDDLVGRAARQRDDIERFRMEAAAAAFSP